MLKGGSRFPVAMADVFPHGCHLVPDSISEAIDYDEEAKRRSPAADKLTGKPVFQVRVIDLDPELSGRSREVVVKVIADRMPVPPAFRQPTPPPTGGNPSSPATTTTCHRPYGCSTRWLTGWLGNEHSPMPGTEHVKPWWPRSRQMGGRHDRQSCRRRW
jgi:hypothetical protein